MMGQMSESRRTVDRIPDLARRTSVVTGASSDLGLATTGHAARRGAHAVASTRLTIDVWADVLCPWCYIGEQRLSTAIPAAPTAPEDQQPPAETDSTRPG
jgi:NAD(P)-dependent dehydrogenase (short-subunit alcohol dehydrogenase family)